MAKTKEQIIQGLRNYFKDVDAIVFKKSMERSVSMGDLFDILSDISNLEYPIVWNDENHKWEHIDVPSNKLIHGVVDTD